MENQLTAKEKRGLRKLEKMILDISKFISHCTEMDWTYTYCWQHLKHVVRALERTNGDKSLIDFYKRESEDMLERASIYRITANKLNDIIKS